MTRTDPGDMQLQQNEKLITSNLVLVVHMYSNTSKYHDFLTLTISAEHILQKMFMFYPFSTW